MSIYNLITISPEDQVRLIKAIMSGQINKTDYPNIWIKEKPEITVEMLQAIFTPEEIEQIKAVNKKRKIQNGKYSDLINISGELAKRLLRAVLRSEIDPDDFNEIWPMPDISNLSVEDCEVLILANKKIEKYYGRN